MFTVFRWQLAIDFLVLYAALYGVLVWARSARALRIALGVVGLHAGAVLARQLDLIVTGWVLEGAAIMAVLLLLIVFPPELRRAFAQLDRALRHTAQPATTAQGSRALATALFTLAKQRLGALVVLTGRGPISDLLEGGVALGADISSHLLVAIFQKDSPLHDGAVIVENNRLARAGVVLPLTQRSGVPDAYGTRHRAAMGMAERSDAVVLVVSEERSEVTLMYGNRIQPISGPADLMAALKRSKVTSPASAWTRFRRRVRTNFDLKLAALGVASLIWGMSFLGSATVRSMRIPVEFSGVPPGLVIVEQSARTLEIQVQGSSLIMDSVPMGRVTARFDLDGMTPGWHTLTLGPNSLDLPPGVTVDRVTPNAVRVRLGRIAAPSP